jgi:hypothetical protein
MSVCQSVRELPSAETRVRAEIWVHEFVSRIKRGNPKKNNQCNEKRVRTQVRKCARDESLLTAVAFTGLTCHLPPHDLSLCRRHPFLRHQGHSKADTPHRHPKKVSQTTLSRPTHLDTRRHHHSSLSSNVWN